MVYTPKTTCLGQKPSSILDQQKILNTLLVREEQDSVEAGYGRCSVGGCPCPGFFGTGGSGYQCMRGGCGHHWDEHW